MSKTDGYSCPYVKKCGACEWINEEYRNTLLKKEEDEIELLSSFGKVSPIVGMNFPYYYRHKVHAVVGYDSRLKENFCGTYRAGTHELVRIDSCLIEDRKSQDIIRDVVSMMQDFKIKDFNEDRDTDGLRHVLVRKSYASNEFLLVLVMASTYFPSKKNFVRAITSKHPEITSVVLSINTDRTSMVLGSRNEVLYGSGYITDKLLSKKFRISASSFFQVNPLQAKKLYQLAGEAAALKGDETLIDAYCGTGTIGLSLADKARKLIGIELNHDAVADARANAVANNVKNAEFICSDAGRYLSRFKTGDKLVLIMDPPRSGSSEEFLNSVLRLMPDKVVYVSCDPHTLARDLKILTRRYTADTIIPVDMFPFTTAIETVVCLNSKK